MHIYVNFRISAAISTEEKEGRGRRGGENPAEILIVTALTLNQF